MKIVSLVLNSIIFIALGILYYLHFSSKKIENHKKITTTEESTLISFAKSDTNYNAKIGYINVDSLQLKYDYYDELKHELENKEKSYDAELKAKSALFQKKVEDFQRKAPTMTQFEGELKQKELAKEEENLYKIRDEYTQSYEIEMVKLNNQLYKAIKEYIVLHNKKTNFDIIIGESQTRNFVLDFNKEIDITKEVVEGLNKKFNEDKLLRVKQKP